MKFLKNLAVAGSVLAFAGIAGAATIQYDQTLTGNGFYAGVGNYPQHFATLTTDDNLQLALRAGNRYNGPVITPSGDNYDYNANPNTDPNKNWGYYYSIDTRFGGGDGTIGDYTYLLTVLDENTAQSFSYNPIVPDDSYYDATVHGGNGNSTPIGDQNAFYGVQNANWPGYFNAIQPSFNFDPTHTFTITLAATSTGQSPVTESLSIRVNGTPEPGTIVLMLSSLGALGLVARRRKA